MKHGHVEYERPSRNRLYRNKERSILGGVCAGIADWTGFNLTALRVITVLLALPFTAVMLIGYIVLWILLPRRPVNLYRDEHDEAFWQEVRKGPKDGVSSLNHRFRELDKRLQRMEAWLTSSEYRIDRELRD
ncbi:MULTISPECIES: envelope stress response membrane protein PspC [unclassified Wenzhouxiangella]|uniref:envelope stress response membrane protein PspC n=1 Tax=unclassified Wenzhouxiangella TaxID=2613841 RepID=UPI000E32526E|nr:MULTISPECIES: envelope stress response membrane protein PspC [unclassified Wenzhouxiangella]RFF27831.1 envelope stress response membrane protein PspC [Wenzhouxiangella sp. 15181]RFP70325.1 envelope stress response membrane protein PspC [Wenzhouxiangella sp. 15190]